MDSNTRGSKFNLDCLEFKSSYILLINAINFMLCLINYVYFFERPGKCTPEQFIVNIVLTITSSNTIKTVLEST